MLERIRTTLNATLSKAIVPLVTALIGVVSLAVALTISVFQSPSATGAIIFFWIAQTTLSAGLVVGVMRALQSADYFENGLRRILYDDRLPGPPIDHQDAWHKLTLALIRTRFTQIEVNAEEFSYTKLIGPDDFYYTEHRRFLTIECDDKCKNLKINDIVEATLHTANTGRMIPFQNWFKADGAGATTRTTEWDFSGGFTRKVLDSDMVDDPVKGRGFRLELPPSATITVRRETNKMQDLDLDPILNYVTTGLILRPRIDIRCSAELRFYFRKMGTPDDFIAEGGVRDLYAPVRSLVAQYRGLCLRNQGYVIVVVRA